MQKAFQRITPEQYTSLSQNTKVIKKNIFLKKTDKGHIEPHMLALTSKFLVYYKNQLLNQVKRVLKVDYSTKFEILKDTQGKDVAIKFERQGCIPYQLYCQQQNVIRVWQQLLEKYINKRGFHQEIRAIKRIGKGNFATVYLSERIRDNLKVAVKAFSKEQVYSQQKGRESLINQIQIMRRFNHKNILKLISVYESANSLYLVIQYLEGLCLNEIITKQKLTISEIGQVMSGLLHGVAEMARLNVIHRDLKPQNIMFRTKQINSDIIIIDFGLATDADQPQYIYTRCGTPGYVAPQIVNLKDIKAKSKPISDVFSVGIIFHLLLLGYSPFKGKTFNEVLIQNRACSFVLKGQRYDELPIIALDLLRQMLEINPKLRSSAEQCLKHQFLFEAESEINKSTITSKIKASEQINSSKPLNQLQDSLGTFDMKSKAPKGSSNENGGAHSIHLKQEHKTETLNVPKKSKFTNYRKKSGQDDV